MKTNPASVRDSWAYRKWGAGGARTYVNVTFAALGAQVLLLLAGFVYFTFISQLLPPLLFTLACCLFLLVALKLFGMHRKSLREVEEAGSSQCDKIPANV
ncbi:MAG: hypothetical protein RL514_4132 [Verrucomicrobiota bacterium]|jgi:membrane protein implicated in regulation of membrane protease activity